MVEVRLEIFVGILRPLFVDFGCYEGKAGVFADGGNYHHQPALPPAIPTAVFESDMYLWRHNRMRWLASPETWQRLGNDCDDGEIRGGGMGGGSDKNGE